MGRHQIQTKPKYKLRDYLLWMILIVVALSVALFGALRIAVNCSAGGDEDKAAGFMCLTFCVPFVCLMIGTARIHPDVCVRHGCRMEFTYNCFPDEVIWCPVCLQEENEASCSVCGKEEK